MTRPSQWPLLLGLLLHSPWIPLPRLYRVAMAYAVPFRSIYMPGSSSELAVLSLLGHLKAHPLPLQFFAQVVFLGKACPENSGPSPSSVLLSPLKHDALWANKKAQQVNPPTAKSDNLHLISRAPNKGEK